MTHYRLLLRPEVLHQLAALARAAQTQGPGGLRTREFLALKAGLRALAEGREEEYDGKRLTYRRHDLCDCAEIKLAVIPESRHNIELGPSHRLIYREFEAEDGGPPYREVVTFAHRGNDRPFTEAAARLSRRSGTRLRGLQEATPSPTPSPAAPIRQQLPPDLRTALAAAANVAPASGAVTALTAPHTPAAIRPRNDGPHRSR
jgi:hypothetical protein